MCKKFAKTTKIQKAFPKESFVIYIVVKSFKVLEIVW